MAERKVLNKYYPPDFDPSKIPRRKAPKNDQYKVRLMAPFNMRCTACGVYIYKASKFNARKETVHEETYLGIPIFRFYIRCPRCAQEISFKTDPENADYKAENGATRNFEMWRETEKEEEEKKKKKEEEEEQNAMKALENRTKQSKREMDMLDTLDQLRERSALHAQVGVQDLIQKNHELLLKQLEMEQEQEDSLVRQYFGADGEVAEVFVKRVDSDDEESASKKRKLAGGTLANDEVVKQVKKETKTALAGLVKPKPKASGLNIGIAPKASAAAKASVADTSSDSAAKASVADTSSDSAAGSNGPGPAAAGISLLGGYGDSSSGSDPE